MSDEMKNPLNEEGISSEDTPAQDATAQDATVEEDTAFKETPPPPPPRPDPAALSDDTVIHRFRTADISAVDRLNWDFGLALTSDSLGYLQAYYRDTARREPSLGELRVMDALMRMPEVGELGDRHAVRELVTDSPVIAETWTDMMEKHRRLSLARGTAVPPCTWEDALLLTARYLRRVRGERVHRKHRGRRGDRGECDYSLIYTPAQELEAIAAGLKVDAWVALEGGRQLAVVRRAGPPLYEAPPHTGDMILYCPTATAEALTDFMEYQRHMSKPYIGALRVVTRRALLLTALELASGLDLCAYRLLPERQWSTGKLPLERLCRLPDIRTDRAEVLMRVPVKHTRAVMDELRRCKLDAVVLGQVVPGERLVLRTRDAIRSQDIVAASLSPALIHSMATVTARTCAPTLHADAPVVINRPAMSRLPSTRITESGLTPAGNETVALTVTPADTLTISGDSLCMAVASTSVSTPGAGFVSAGDAVVAVTDSLRARVGEDCNLSLSVMLTVYGTPGDMVAETVCGLYRAAALRALPIEDPVFTVKPSDREAVSLLVTAWAQAPFALESSDDLQWRSSKDLSSADRTDFIFPTLRRSMEGSLRALVCAMDRRGIHHNIIQPVVINREKVSGAEEDMELDVPPRTETREVLDPASVERFLATMGEDVTPVFAMSDTDAHLFLSHAAIRSALDRRLLRGGHIIVLGNACAAFATCGYLSDALAVLDTLPFTGKVSVDYIGLPDVPSVTRLVRRALLAPRDADVPHVLTLTLPDGSRIPDGFVGREGCVLGLLNGVDAVIEPLLLKPRFDIKNTDTERRIDHAADL